MRTFFVVGFPWFLAACGTPDTKDTGTVSIPNDDPTQPSPTTHPGCDALLTSVTPPDQTLAFLPTQEVMATFSSPVDPIDAFSILIVGATGTTTLAPDGLSMTWNGTLETNTTYTATFRVCSDEQQSTFTTAPPPIDLATLEGNTYALPWPDVTITEPANLDVFSFDLDYLLAQFFDIDTGAQTAAAAGTLGWGTPDPAPDCEYAVADQVVDFSGNPYFEISGTFEIVIDTYGTTAVLEDFTLTGVIDDDGATLADPALTGLLAPEELPLVGGDCYSDAIQQLLVPTCLPCDSSVNGFCVLIEAHAPQALLNANVDILGECNL